MDQHALAKRLFGKDESQGDVVGRTRTYFGTAVSDSKDGRVVVSTDGTMVTQEGAGGVEVDCATSVKAGQRVAITVVNGSPTRASAAGWGDAIDADVAAQTAYFQQLFAQDVTADTINAMAAYVNEVTAGSVSADQVTAIEGAFDRLSVGDLDIDQIEALSAIVDKVKAGSVTAAEVDAMRGLFEELGAGTLTADEMRALLAVVDEVRAGTVSAQEVRAAQGYIEDLTARNITAQTLAADHADVGTLKTTKLDADLGNFSTLTADVAKVKELFGASGWFEEVSIEGGYVTGKLTAVLIDGDAASIKNVKADSLTLLGDDGLYYALNVNALGQATAEALPEDEQEALREGIHGSNIIAGTITADKVTVTDLAAFGALIAGMRMESGSLHTVGKDALNSAAPGFFLDSDGNLSIGDGENYLTFYEGLDGKWHLDVSADEMTFGGNTPVTQVEFANAIVREGWEWAANYNRASAPSGGWSGTPPALSDGMCLWRRSVTQRADGTVQTGPAECVTGNQGAAGADAVQVSITSTNGVVFKRSLGVSTTLEASVLVGGERIETLSALRARFGAGAYLEWSIWDVPSQSLSTLLASDSRISRDGFALTVSPQDVDTQARVTCNLNY